ncbi:MAG: hypothetical protein R2857_13165 [Vampirovibrionales bacterium]
MRAVNPANRLSEALRQDDYQALVDHAGADNPDNGSVYHTDVYVSGGQDTALTCDVFYGGGLQPRGKLGVPESGQAASCPQDE